MQGSIRTQLSRELLSDIAGSAGKRVVEGTDFNYMPDARARHKYEVQG